MKKYKYDYGNIINQILSCMISFIMNTGRVVLCCFFIAAVKSIIDKYLLNYNGNRILDTVSIILCILGVFYFLFLTFRIKGVYINKQYITIKRDVFFDVIDRFTVKIPFSNIKGCYYYCGNTSKMFLWDGNKYPIKFFNWDSLVVIEDYNNVKYYLPIQNADEFIKEINSYIKSSVVNEVSVVCPLKNDCKSAVTEIGIDYKVPALTDVFAASEGVVQLVQKWNKTSTGMQYLGNMIIVDNGNNVKTIYGNLHEIFIEDGMHINQGEKIATTGNTGICDEPQLHFEVRLNGSPVNPNHSLKQII